MAYAIKKSRLLPAAPPRECRLPDLAPEFKKTWRESVSGILMRALELNWQLLYQPVKADNCMLSERESKRLEVAQQWLDRYIPKPRHPEELDSQASLTSLPAQVIISIKASLEQVERVQARLPVEVVEVSQASPAQSQASLEQASHPTDTPGLGDCSPILPRLSPGSSKVA